MKNRCVVFDLDDTLFYEIDFLKSAYQEIANQFSVEEYLAMLEKYYNKEDVFQYLSDKYAFDKKELLRLYREHFPNILLREGAEEVLSVFKKRQYRLGLITDGRSITQRNKLKALEIELYFDKIIISEEFGTEKPSEKNYTIFHEFFADEYFYIGDNIKKDFVAPNQLGWKTICLLEEGWNVHPQDFDSVSQEYLPLYKVKKLQDLLDVIR